jgi:hypothetical protein
MLQCVQTKVNQVARLWMPIDGEYPTLFMKLVKHSYTRSINGPDLDNNSFLGELVKKEALQAALPSLAKVAQVLINQYGFPIADNHS